MWLLSWVPDAFLEMMVNAVLITGAVSTVLSFFVINRLLRWIPPLARWVNLLQIISAVLLLSGIYFKGSFSTEQSWRQRVAEVEKKLKTAEAESERLNDALAKKTAEKNKVIRGKEFIVKQYIDREVTKYDTTCPVPAPVVKALNAAAKQEEIK